MTSSQLSLTAILYRNRFGLVISALVLLTQSLIVVLLPLPVRTLIDQVLPLNSQDVFTLDFLLGRHSGDRSHWLWLISFGLAGLILLKFLMDYLEETTLSQCAAKMVEGLRVDLSQKLMGLRLPFFEKFNSVDILGRVAGDTATLEFIVTSALGIFLRALPTLFFVLAMMIWVQPSFAFALLLFAPLMTWLSVQLSKQLKSKSRLYRRTQNQFEVTLHQILATMPLIKSLSIEKDVLSEIHTHAQSVTHSLITARKAQGLMTASLNGLRNFLWLSVIALGGFGYIKGEVTMGELVLFLAYTDSLSKPLAEIAKFLTKYQRVQTSVERLQNLQEQALHYPEVVVESKNPFPSQTQLELELRHVSFAYESNKFLFQELSGKFKTRELVAVIGASGAGKSSFAKLLNRLLEPTNGKILINGLPLDWIDLQSLRQAVICLPQDTLFVSKNVQHNLSLGIDPADQQIHQALTHIHGLELIEKLPLGLKTAVNEHGHPLSGGQKRIVHIARALLRNQARILVFDEPTVGIDPQISGHIAHALRDLADQGKLIFWITHDLTHLHLADRVLYLRPQQAALLGTSLSLQNELNDFRHHMQGELL